jgi:HAD superfamily hydrolase (TIGR01549 family)
MAEWLGGGGLRPARAIVFDKDGVLVDFASRWIPIVRARASRLVDLAGLSPNLAPIVLAEWGVRAGELDPSGPLVLAPRHDSLVLGAGFLYRQGIAWMEARELAEQAFVQADAAGDERLRALGELAPTLEALQERGLLLGLATTDTAARARSDLARLGVLDRFKAIRGGDEVSQAKPHPDLLLAVARDLGVPPSEVWVVGDAAGDMLMARAAGAAGAIAVTSGVGTADTLSPVADVVLSGIAELPGLIQAGEAHGALVIDPEAWYTVYTDGAARGNPGPAALGAVVISPDGRVLAEASEALGIQTNNVAEYRALLRGVAEARALGIRKLVVRADSELMVRQLQGQYAVKSEQLQPLYRAAVEALRGLAAYRVEHVRRAANAHADRLANEALDR